MMIGYKLLADDMGSLTNSYGRVIYGREWQDVPGKGAFIAITVAGLLVAGHGPVLAEIEYERGKSWRDISALHVIRSQRVRILRTARVDEWTWVRLAIYAAQLVAHLADDACVVESIKSAVRCERERTVDAADATVDPCADAIHVTTTSAEKERWASANAAWAASYVAVAARRAMVTPLTHSTWDACEAIESATRAAQVASLDLTNQMDNQLRALFQSDGERAA